MDIEDIPSMARYAGGQECPGCDRAVSAAAKYCQWCGTCLDNEESVAMSHLHEVPWPAVEGAFVRVRVERTDHAAIGSVANPDAHRQTEIREGTIVGRGAGRGVAYDSGESRTKPINIGPSIYLDTPQDTVLEVRTDKLENELLEFQPEGSDGD